MMMRPPAAVMRRLSYRVPLPKMGQKAVGWASAYSDHFLPFFSRYRCVWRATYIQYSNM